MKLRKKVIALALAFLTCCVSTAVQAALVYPTAPAGGRQMAQDYLRSILSTEPGFLGGGRLEELTMAQPCQSYHVGLTNLAAGQLLSAVKSRHQWGYLVMHGTNALGQADVLADAKTGKALNAVSLGKNSFAGQTLEALRRAEQLPQVKKTDYEVRRLDCPSLLFVAVWLHGPSDDIIIPLGPTFGRWNAYQPYTERELIQLLKPEAEKKLKTP